MAVERTKLVDEPLVSALPELSVLRGRHVVFTVVPEDEQTGTEISIVLGMLRGRVHVHDDFDAALPDDVLRNFEGV